MRKAHLKHILSSILPGAILYRLWHLRYRRRPRTALSTAMGIRVFEPQKGVRLEVYWSNVPEVGLGPSASLFVLMEEVLRLDCFGEDKGHMHLNPEQTRIDLPMSPRLYFPSGTREEHIRRAAFELASNAQSALKLNKLGRIRAFAIDQKSLANAAEEMADYMSSLLVKHAPPPAAGLAQK